MKLKIDGKLYDEPSEGDASLTIGEQRQLKREYGFIPARDGLDLNDPDHQAFFLFLVFRKASPNAPAATLFPQIDEVRSLERVNDDGSPITDADVEAEDAIAKDPTPPLSETESASEPEPVAAGS